VLFWPSLAKILRALALLSALLAACACTGENQQFKLPPELTVRGSFVAAMDDDGKTYLLNRVLLAERFPEDIETVLHMITYQERASSIEQATELAKSQFLYVQSRHNKVLARDYVQREWKVVWFRTLNAEEESYLLE
jgi:hypothetical protein